MSSPPPSEPQATPQAQTPKDPAEELPWNLLLVNAEHALPATFNVETTALASGKTVDSRIYSALEDMLAAGSQEGLTFVVCSAYRTVAHQQTLFDDQINRYISQGLSRADAQAKTSSEIAIPGTSEHSLGLAVDIVSYSYQNLDEQQAETPEQQWLMAHCSEYGFILRYPVDKSDITGIIYEPWHYRYVGVDAATEIMAQGITLEEYLLSADDL